MEALPMQLHLKRHLYCVFLTAMTYNPNYTLQYLEKNNATKNLLVQIFEMSSSFTNIYERKMFIVGLSNILNAEALPPSLADSILQIVD